jgi:hypothetical protein
MSCRDVKPLDLVIQKHPGFCRGELIEILRTLIGPAFIIALKEIDRGLPISGKNTLILGVNK